MARIEERWWSDYVGNNEVWARDLASGIVIQGSESRAGNRYTLSIHPSELLRTQRRLAREVTD